MLDAERERVKECFTYVECLLLITPERLSVFWSSTPQVSCDTWRFIMNLLLTSENMPTNKRINKPCLQKKLLKFDYACTVYSKKQTAYDVIKYP